VRREKKEKVYEPLYNVFPDETLAGDVVYVRVNASGRLDASMHDTRARGIINLLRMRSAGNN
jgi:hypothetical protein